MTTDWRALCFELTEALCGYTVTDQDVALTEHTDLPHQTSTPPHLIFANPPSPKGYWIIEKNSWSSINFAMHKKPNRLHRLMAKFLLGWDWQDNA